MKLASASAVAVGCAFWRRGSVQLPAGHAQALLQSDTPILIPRLMYLSDWTAYPVLPIYGRLPSRPQRQGGVGSEEAEVASQGFWGRYA